MRAKTIKPNAKRVDKQNINSLLKMMVKLTKNGNIKVANRQCNIGLNGVSANDTNYKNYPLGA